MAQLNLTLPDRMVEEFRSATRADGTTMVGVIRAAIIAYCDRLADQQPVSAPIPDLSEIHFDDLMAEK